MIWKGSVRGGSGRWGVDWIRQGNRYNEGCGEEGGREEDVSPGISASVSSGCPGRSWPYGPQSPYGWGPTPPGWAPVGPTPSSAVPPSDGAPDSPRLASAWPASCCCPTPLVGREGAGAEGEKARQWEWTGRRRRRSRREKHEAMKGWYSWKYRAVLLQLQSQIR